MEISQYYPEFFSLALAHLVAVASPGPDFAIVMKHAISHGKRIALITSAGIGAAIFIHVAYALLGIGLIINSTAWLYDALIVTASGFLLYIGLSAIKSKPMAEQSSELSQYQSITQKKAFYLGFLTNGLNPKATLFFLSLFTVIVSADTPTIVKSAYGVYLALATTVWFCVLSFFLSRKTVRNFFSSKGYLFDRTMGGVLILLALNIFYSEILNKYISLT